MLPLLFADTSRYQPPRVPPFFTNSICSLPRINSIAVKGEPIVPYIVLFSNILVIMLETNLLSTPLRSHLPYSSIYPSQQTGILCKIFKHVLFSSLRFCFQIWKNRNTSSSLCQELKLVPFLYFSYKFFDFCSYFKYNFAVTLRIIRAIRINQTRIHTYS